MAKAPAPKKVKNPPPPPEEDDDDFKKGGEEKEAEAPPKKSRSTLKLIILIAAAMVVGIGGTVAVMKLTGSSSHPAPAAEGQAPVAEGEHAAPPVAPQRAGAQGDSGGHGGGQGSEAADGTAPLNIEFKPFIVNLNDLGGRRMLKLTMSVEAESQELADEINAKMPMFRDTILLLLSSIQSDDVAGLDGKQRLKNQMINRINPNLNRGKIRNLYFSEIVVQ